LVGSVHYVCKSNDLSENAMKIFKVNNTDVLVGRVKGKLFACNNSCPHRGASLGFGHLTCDNIVCYMHGYEYNVFDGRLVNMKSWKKEETWMEQTSAWRESGSLELYRIFEENGGVYVSL
jgi:nitrite reductase/ring-hydroxylating ferredoxin subunit